MKINTVALMGAGAVGAFFIRNMSPAMKNDFYLIADGDRKAKLEKNGIRINGNDYIVPVLTAKQAHGVDLLIIATKYDALKNSLDDIRTIVGPDTLVLPVLNGIDSEEIVESAIGPGHVIRAFMRIVAHRDQSEIMIDDAVTHGVIFGEEDGTVSERIQALCELFQRTNVIYKADKNIMEAQWNKFGVNISNNLPQAVLGVGYHAYFNSEHMKYIHQRIIEEFAKVTAAKGYQLYLIPTPPNAAMPEARFSTLQDLDAGRHTEVDMLLGVFLKEAKRLGIDTPFCEYTYHAIKVLEEKNDRKII